MEDASGLSASPSPSHHGGGMDNRTVSPQSRRRQGGHPPNTPPTNNHSMHNSPSSQERRVYMFGGPHGGKGGEYAQPEKHERELVTTTGSAANASSRPDASARLLSPMHARFDLHGSDSGNVNLPPISEGSVDTHHGSGSVFPPVDTQHYRSDQPIPPHLRPSLRVQRNSPSDSPPPPLQNGSATHDLHTSPLSAKIAADSAHNSLLFARIPHSSDTPFPNPTQALPNSLSPLHSNKHDENFFDSGEEYRQLHEESESDRESWTTNIIENGRDSTEFGDVSSSTSYRYQGNQVDSVNEVSLLTQLNSRGSDVSLTIGNMSPSTRPTTAATMASPSSARRSVAFAINPQATKSQMLQAPSQPGTSGSPSLPRRMSNSFAFNSLTPQQQQDLYSIAQHVQKHRFSVYGPQGPAPRRSTIVPMGHTAEAAITAGNAGPGATNAIAAPLQSSGSEAFPFQGQFDLRVNTFKPKTPEPMRPSTAVNGSPLMVASHPSTRRNVVPTIKMQDTDDGDGEEQQYDPLKGNLLTKRVGITFPPMYSKGGTAARKEGAPLTEPKTGDEGYSPNSKAAGESKTSPSRVYPLRGARAKSAREENSRGMALGSVTLGGFFGMDSKVSTSPAPSVGSPSSTPNPDREGTGEGLLIPVSSNGDDAESGVASNKTHHQGSLPPQIEGEKDNKSVKSQSRDEKKNNLKARNGASAATSSPGASTATVTPASANKVRLDIDLNALRLPNSNDKPQVSFMSFSNPLASNEKPPTMAIRNNSLSPGPLERTFSSASLLSVPVDPRVSQESVEFIPNFKRKNSILMRAAMAAKSTSRARPPIALRPPQRNPRFPVVRKEAKPVAKGKLVKGGAKKTKKGGKNVTEKGPVVDDSNVPEIVAPPLQEEFDETKLANGSEPQTATPTPTPSPGRVSRVSFALDGNCPSDPSASPSSRRVSRLSSCLPRTSESMDPGERRKSQSERRRSSASARSVLHMTPVTVSP